MKPFAKVLIVIVIVVAIIGIIVRITGFRFGKKEQAVVPPAPKGPIEMSVIAALPVEQWVSLAGEKYNTGEHFVEGRKVLVEVIPMDGLSALNKWERGEFDPVPTAWLAESRAWVDQANIGVAKRTGRDVFLAGGQYRAQPVILSPIVWGIWKEAHDTLRKHFKRTDISWDELHKAATIGKWTKLGGQAEWGAFKLVIAHPKRDPAGLVAMVGAAGEYYDKPIVTSDEFQDTSFLKWLADLLNTVVDFSPFGVENMLLFGRSNGDVGQIVESYLLANMEGLQKRWKEPLVILYPDPIAWFDFPYAIYMGTETSALEKKAALDFKNFLLSTGQQRSALDLGLRPANPDVPSTGGLVKRWEDLGVKAKIPSASRMRYASRRGLDALSVWYSAKYEE